MLVVYFYTCTCKIFTPSSVMQSRNAREKLYDDLYEMSKPLARYAEDEDLEKRLKERERDGDPMLAFIKKTKKVKIEEKGLPKKGW